MNNYIPKLISLAEKVAFEVMKIYNQDDFDIHIKSDNSPVTKADLLAHQIITDGLKEISHYPILSEEDANISWEERSQWQKYWLIDPIDGTKEFIRRNGEFTINIALIENGKAVMGIVLAPALNLLYAADSEEAFVIRDGIRKELKAQLPKNDEILKVVASKSHRDENLENYLATLPKHQEIPVGSSLKLCYIAEGLAHFCPRLGSISEWDIAAANAILTASGGEIVHFDSDETLSYNQKDSIRTPWYRARVKGLNL